MPQGNNKLWRAKKQAILQDKLQGYWLKDEWSSDDFPLAGYNGPRHKIIRFNKIPSGIRTELKYACWSALMDEQWSPRNFWTNGYRNIRVVINWLCEDVPQQPSLFDEEPKYWRTRFSTYLVQHGRAIEIKQPYINKHQQIAYRSRPSLAVSMLNVVLSILRDFYDDRPEYEKDIWDLREMGVPLNAARSDYKLIFSDISQPWIFRAAKLYIKYNLSTHSSANVFDRLRAIRLFSQFLSMEFPGISESDVNRSVIVEYLSFISSQQWAPSTKAKRVSNLRDFFETNFRESWVPGLEAQLIFSDDIPQQVYHKPRYIPEIVLEQLNAHLDLLPTHIMRMVLVIQECGMRISELCELPVDCLRQDADGDWFLKYYQGKTKKEHIIPIGQEIANVLLEQQDAVKKTRGNNGQYLFPGKKGAPMKWRVVCEHLNKLAVRVGIRDENREIFRFQSHQFRHTVGTRMVNLGVPHHVIQHYLGQSSPYMVGRYAYIHDQTLKKAVMEFRGRTVDINGMLVEDDAHVSANSIDSKLLKNSIMFQALPNGNCSLPVAAGPCSHANSCLTCTHFRTSHAHLDHHRRQLEHTHQLIEKARKNQWIRQLEMNEQVAASLERIIGALEND